jgi:hypothetical protein
LTSWFSSATNSSTSCVFGICNSCFAATTTISGWDGNNISFATYS